MNEILVGTVAFSAIVLTLTFIVMGAKTFLQPGHAVSISINDAAFVTARSGDTLFTALSDADYHLPGTCGGKGTCGLCRVTIPAGAGDPLPAEKSKLSRKELRDHIRLACQIVLRSDLAIELPASMRDVVTVTGRVIRTRQLAPLIKEIVFELPAGCGLEPEAGSFIEVDVPKFEMSYSELNVPAAFSDYWQRLRLARLSVANHKNISRAYSIANRPRDKDQILLNVRLAIPPPDKQVPPGIASSYLFGLVDGDEATIRGPFGYFRVQNTGREMIFIGGGVGMAPLRAMIFDQLEQKRTHRTISYWYGARTRTDLLYAEEFEDLAARYSNFTWTAALSEPPKADNWQGPVGFVHDVIRTDYLDTHPAPEDCEYYLCGPPMMIRAVRLMLEDLGVDAEDIFFDDFGS